MELIKGTVVAEEIALEDVAVELDGTAMVIDMDTCEVIVHDGVVLEGWHCMAPIIDGHVHVSHIYIYPTITAVSFRPS